MNLRDMNYEYELPEEAIRPFERKVLESGLCDFAVPMSFFRYQGKQIIKYECSGYIALSDMRLNELKDIFEVLEQTMLALKKSGEFLMNPDKITLNGDTVYVHYKHKDVRLAYIPGALDNNEKCRNLIEFFQVLKEQTPESGMEYFDRLEKELTQNNRSLSDLITVIGEIRREIYLCDIQ